VYTGLVREPARLDHLADTGFDERIILKYVLKVWVVKLWMG
jgi:hypothetical protein